MSRRVPLFNPSTNLIGDLQNKSLLKTIIVTDQIINAVKLINKNKIILNEKNIEDNLYTKNIPNPDLLIRTGNTNRLSNFLLWQLAYTEIFFEKKLWPDFNPKDYTKILNKFRILKRNFGNI